MGIEKSELKIDMAKNIGQHYAALIKEGSEEVLRCEGERRAYQQAAEALNPIFARVDQDLQNSKFDEVSEPLAFAKMVKDYLVLVVSSLESLKARAEVNKIHTLGNVNGILKASEYIQRIAASEQGKLEATLAALEGQPSVSMVEGEESIPLPSGKRPTGYHPGMSEAAQRKAERTSSVPTKDLKAKIPEPEPIMPAQLPSLKKGSRVIKQGGPGTRRS